MRDNNRIYVDLHVLQTVPPSCVNRDDTGSPKTAVYGGVNRARVSSQAWKRAMRVDFRELFPQEQLGQRTKSIVGLVAEQLSALEPELTGEKAEKAAIKALENAGVQIKDAKKGSDALFFISVAQAKALAALAIEDEQDKKAYKAALLQAPSVDMALFGRMVASDPSLNYDAAAQVAHSISTHGIHNEYDFFSAVDDCAPEDNAGAAHLGTVEYNSATLYRYATVNVRELEASLGSETARTVRQFAESFLRSMPTGKQNTFANRTLPDAVYITIRTDQPVNLSGAFEKPVQGGTEGYVAASEKRIVAYAKKLYSRFAAEPAEAFCIGEELTELGQELPLSQLLDKLEAAVGQRLAACGVG